MFGAGFSINSLLQALSSAPPSTLARVHHLNLDGCSEIAEASLLDLLKRCRNVRALRGSGLRCVTEAVAKVIGGLPCLRYLDVSNCDLNDGTAGALFVALQEKGTIRKLSIANGAGLTDKGMKQFGETIAGLLTDFCMAGCFRVTDAGIMMIAL